MTNSDPNSVLLSKLVELAAQVQDQPHLVLSKLEAVFEQNPGLREATEKVLTEVSPTLPQPLDGLKKPSNKIAIVMDFDETLTVENTFSGFAREVLDMSDKEFVEKYTAVKQTLKEQGIGSLHAVEMIINDRQQELIDEGRGVTLDKIAEYARTIKVAPGLEGPDNFFDRVRSYCAEKGLEPEFHMVSFSNEYMISKSSVADQFDSIRGSQATVTPEGFMDRQVEMLGFSDKTRLLDEISKGIVEECRLDPGLVNRRLPEKIPVDQMIVFGDGETDIAIMAMAQKGGGMAVGVYNEAHPTKHTKLLADDQRTDALVPQDYRAGSKLDVAVKGMIDSIAKKVANKNELHELATGKVSSTPAEAVAMPSEEEHSAIRI